MPVHILTMSAIPVSVPASADPDAVALDRLRAGDRGAAAGIWERHGGAVWRVAVRCCRNPADAEDVMQEVAVDLLRRPPAGIRGGGLRAWLCLAAANRARKRLRDEGRRQRREVPMMDRPAPAPAESPALAERALAALAGLPAAYREPVRLRCVERLDFPLVAAACGIGERTARTRVARGLARLRDILGVPGTGLAGIALLLPVQPAPAMPVGLPATLTAAPVIATATVGVGSLAAIIGAGALAAGVAVVIAGGGGTVHGGGPGGDASPASATMAALRAWRDPSAALQMEIDLDRLRGPALMIPPFSALRDERTRDVQRWIVGLEQQANLPEAYRPMAHALVATVRAGGGVTVSNPDRSSGPQPHMPVIALDVGEAEVQAPRLGQRIGPARVRTAYGSGDRRLVVQDGPRWIFGVESVLARLAAQAPHAVAETAPAWVRFDASTLVAAYARLAPPDLDPAGVSELIGPDWRTTRPVLTATAAIDARGWIGGARLTGVAPFQPLRAVEALPGYLRRVLGPFRPMADTCRLAVGPDDLIRLDAGIRLDPAVAGEFARDLGFDTTLLTGDVSLRIQPGVPFPIITAAVGVQRDGADVAAGFAKLLGLQMESTAADGPWSPGVWTGVSPLGASALRWNRDTVAIVSGTTAAPRLGPAWSTGDMALRIDGPRTAAVLIPLLTLAGMARDPDVAQAIRLVRPAIPHLPVWDLAVSTTADGFAASERGAPLLVPGLGLLSYVINDTSAPVAETELGMLGARVVALLQDPVKADLIRRLRCPPGTAKGALTLPARLRQCGVTPAELAAVLGLPADTPAERIGFPVQTHSLDLVDPRQPQGRFTYTTRGEPIDGWEIPLGNGLSLFLVEFINTGRDVHIGTTSVRPPVGPVPGAAATAPGAPESGF